MIIRLQTAGRMIVICAIVISISTSADLNSSTSSFSNATGEEQNQSPPKGITIPNDRYLQARVIVNGFKLTADLAITDDEKTKGLAIKDNLKENESMLFVSEEPSRQSFWMKDMKFPIDIIWLDSNGTVVHIEHNLQPCVSILNTGSSILNCPTYTPDKDSLYVLETIAGFSQKHDVKIGTNIDFYFPSTA
jgi:uncharacterized membrane protein (UPF0127 family)